MRLRVLLVDLATIFSKDPQQLLIPALASRGKNVEVALSLFPSGAWDRLRCFLANLKVVIHCVSRRPRGAYRLLTRLWCRLVCPAVVLAGRFLALGCCLLVIAGTFGGCSARPVRCFGSPETIALIAPMGRRRRDQETACRCQVSRAAFGSARSALGSARLRGVQYRGIARGKKNQSTMQDTHPLNVNLGVAES